MKTFLSTRVFTIIYLITLLSFVFPAKPVHASSDDPWWDEDWPYRVRLSTTGDGTTAVHPDFTALFAQLGLPNALLDLASIRIVPYMDGAAGEPVPYEETLSTLIMDGESLNLDPGGADPYWIPGDQATLSLDSERFSEGTGAIRAEILRQANLFSQPGFNLAFDGTDMTDWSAYEILTYDVWPEVNETAIDQTTDLYQLEFKGVQLCPLPRVNGPSLVMDQWNHTSTSLVPLGACTEPDFSDMEGLRFFLSTLQPGDFDAGDRLTLWLDDLRLVDQDGEGKIRWLAEEQVDTYYLYFDTLNHTGHPEPEQTSFSETEFATATTGEAEAGGYFNQVSGVVSPDLTVWSAPTVEKVYKPQSSPVTQKPIFIQAARLESEAFQLVLQPSADQDLPIVINDLVGEGGSIPASQIQIFRVDYIPLDQISDSFGRLVEWPDPLYPLSSGDSVHFTAGENQPLWVRVTVPGGTPAGLYTGTLSLGSIQIPYALEVWDFYLPESAYLNASVGFDWDTVLTKYSASGSGVSPACVAQLESTILDTLADYHLTPNPDLGNVTLYTLTNYEVQQAQTTQLQTGLPVWWVFTSWDKPPLANPAVIDRPGIDARVLPALAWLDRVDGLYYTQVVDWDSDPWTTPFSNDLSNGDGFLFYPPNDNTIGDNPCEPDSNRLIPSIRLELLREGLEDYAYLYLLNQQSPEIGIENESDLQLQTIVHSRTTFSRVPTGINALRQTVAANMGNSYQLYYLPYITR